MRQTEQRLEKILSRFNAVLEKILAFFIAAMSLILIANVFTRYALSFSLTWSAELARYCMVWAAFLAIAVLVNRGEHLAVDLLEKALQDVPKRLLQGLVLLFSSILYLILTGYGIVLVIQTRDQVAASMDFLPMNLVYSIIPISGAIMLAGALVNIYRLIRRGGSE